MIDRSKDKSYNSGNGNYLCASCGHRWTKRINDHLCMMCKKDICQACTYNTYYANGGYICSEMCELGYALVK